MGDEPRSIPALAKFNYFARELCKKSRSVDFSNLIQSEPSKSIQNCLLTINQAAQELAVHPNTIRNLIASGRLKAKRIGARIVRVQEQDVQALLTPYEGGEYGVWK
jgi:excisionase family DNA binding protein